MKLYWRYKKDGKWNWKAVKNFDIFDWCQKTESYRVKWEEEE
jgi:hypothetical protein